MRKLILSGLALSSLILSACNKEASSKANNAMCVPASQLNGIVGGYKVSNNSALAKKVVIIFAKIGDENTMCTGTPISNDVILTAAHCVYKQGETTAAIKVGFNADITCESGFGANKIIDAKNWIHHKEYSSARHKNDVALIKLSKSIPGDYEVSEIYDGTGYITSSKVILTGYGITNIDKEDNGILRMTVKSIDELRNDKTLVEIPQEKSGLCSGDSGGPAFIEVNGRTKILGVNSFVTGSSYDNYCSGYGYLMYGPKYIPWVQSKIHSL